MDRSLRRSVLEGMAFAVMVGAAESYFLADAIRLHASALQVALVVGLPLMGGAFGPWLALRLLNRSPSRRRWASAAAALQACVLFGLGLADWTGSNGAALLIAGSCLYQVFGQAAGTCWSSWYGDLVPAERRGRYFARRNRAVHAANLVGLIVGGLLLEALEPKLGEAVGAAGRGFAVIFALGGLCRLASCALLLTSSEPPLRGMGDRGRFFQYFSTQRGGDASTVLVLAGGLYLAVYMASPFFTPFMLRDLELRYVEYMAATVCAVGFKVAFLPVWGRGIDGRGSRSVFRLSAFLVGVVPLPWIWSDSLAWVLAAQALSGLTWAGYEVSQFSLLLEITYRRIRPHVFASQSLMNGSAQLLGGLLGSLMSGLWEGNLRLIFAVSAVARLVFAALIHWRLPALQRADARPVVVPWRVLGFRVHGGLVHRPVPEPEPGPDSDPGPGADADAGPDPAPESPPDPAARTQSTGVAGADPAS